MRKISSCLEAAYYAAIDAGVTCMSLYSGPASECSLSAEFSAFGEIRNYSVRRDAVLFYWYGVHHVTRSCLYLEDIELQGALDELQEKANSEIKSAGLIYVLGTHDLLRFGSLAPFGIPVFFPHSFHDLFEMSKEAADLSEILKRPVILYLSKLLLSVFSICSRKQLPYHDYHDIRIDPKYQQTTLKRINKTYNKLTGQGDTLLIALGTAALIPQEMDLSLSRYSILQLRFISAEKDLFRDLLSDAPVRVIVLSSVRVSFAEDLVHILRNLYPHASIRTLCGEDYGLLENDPAFASRIGEVRDKDAYSLPEYHKPLLPGREMRMCPGCPARTKLVALLENVPGDVYVYENVFCSALGRKVESGITDSRVHMLEDEIETEYVMRSRPDARILRFEEKIDRCRKKVRDGVHCYIRRELCKGDGDCVSKIGCPALWKRGFRVTIDPELCIGCGSFMGLCPEGAIRIGKETDEIHS